MFRNYSNYEIYEDGKIWSYKSNKFLKPITLSDGYQLVNLYDNECNMKKYLVHRVVWEAVTSEPIPEGYEINHISEDKTENFFSNLELITHKDNCNFGTRNRRIIETKSKQVGAFKNGELVMTFSSTQEAGRNGFDQRHISACCIGKRKTHKGFQWKYI